MQQKHFAQLRIDTTKQFKSKDEQKVVKNQFSEMKHA